MSLIPEIIYPSIVETLRGKNTNIKCGSRYWTDFTIIINSNLIYSFGDIIDIDVSELDPEVNTSKATALIRDVFTFENDVKIRFYVYCIKGTYGDEVIDLYAWESYFYYPNGVEKIIGQSTTSLFNERALAGFVKTQPLKLAFFTDFYTGSQEHSIISDQCAADAFSAFVFQPSSGNDGINIFDNILEKGKYYAQRTGDPQPYGSESDLFKYAWCGYTGINLAMRYENLETMLSDLNQETPEDPMTGDDVYKVDVPPPDKPIQDDDPSAPGGGGGNYDDSSDPIDFPDLPTGGALTSGAIRAFIVNQGQLDLMFKNLWNSSFFDVITDFQKLVDNPLDALISLHCLPVTPQTGQTLDVLLGSFDTGINAPVITEQYMYVDMGSLSVPEFWGSALDYSPYTKCEIFLPAVGFRELKIEDVMKSTLHVKYAIDVLTGDCIAMVKCGQAVLYKFRGNLKETVPVTSRVNEASFNLMKAGAGIVTGAAVGGVAGAAMGLASAAPQVSASKTHTTRTGDLSGSLSLMDDFEPYIIIHRPYQSLAQTFSNNKGYPSNVSRSLSTLRGYTEVDYIHLTGINATDSELNEIENLLKKGVII